MRGVIGLVDSNGTKMVSYSYDAWGKPISKTGTLASTLGTVQPFRDRGYVYDAETGLYYLCSRYYNVKWARFTCADTVFERNLFVYCSNNPLSFSDEEGQSPSIDYMREMALLHDAVTIRVANYVNGRVERSFTRILGAGRRGGEGYPDVRKRKMVWEVKPFSAYGMFTGPRQMTKYTTRTGFRPGYDVYIPVFSWTLNGKKGIIHIINGCAATNDEGVVYYNFVSFKERKEKEETVPAPSYAYASSPSQSATIDWGSVLGIFAFLIAIASPIPGDEVAAGAALFFAVP